MKTKLKLGKKPATYDKRDLLFARYRTSEPLPSHPKHFGHEKLVGSKAWQMLGNGPDNTVSPGFKGAGDCVFAGGDHETMLWTLEGATSAEFSGLTAIKDYSAVTGYDPKAPLDTHGNNPMRSNTGVKPALSTQTANGIKSALMWLWKSATWTKFLKRSICSASLGSASSFPFPPWTSLTPENPGALFLVPSLKEAIIYPWWPIELIWNALPGAASSK